MISEALRYADDPNAPRVEGDGAGAGSAAATHTGGGDEHWGLRVRRILMTGVSYMIPFVAAGGLLIALSFLLGGYEIVGKTTGPKADQWTPIQIVTTNTLFNLPDVNKLGLEHALFNSPLFAYIGAVFFTIGSTAFSFLSPRLPATSPTRSPTGPVSHQGSSWARSLASSSPGSSAASSAACWPV